MTHPTFDTLEGWLRFDIATSDPYLRETLFQLEHCDTFDGFENEHEYLDRELSTPDMIERLQSALTDQNSGLRGLAARRLISTGHPESEAILLRFLRSADSEDRCWVARVAKFVNSDEVTAAIVKVATTDPKCYIRARACAGMLGKDPCVVIPVLLEVIRHGDENVDPASQSMPPSVIAREVLETILGTSIFDPDAYMDELQYATSCAALEEKAFKKLEELKCQKGA